MDGKLTGIIISWNQERAFGFIRIKNGKNVFAHISAWSENEIAPAVGQKVVFDTKPAAKAGKAHEATDIRLVPASAGANALAGGV